MSSPYFSSIYRRRRIKATCRYRLRQRYMCAREFSLLTEVRDSFSEARRAISISGFFLASLLISQFVSASGSEAKEGMQNKMLSPEAAASREISSAGRLSHSSSAFGSTRQIYEETTTIRLRRQEEDYSLGRILKDLDDRIMVWNFLNVSLKALEAQSNMLDSPSRIRARYRYLYYDAVQVLLDLGQPEKALHLLERYRAQSLLSWLPQSTDVTAFTEPVPGRSELAFVLNSDGLGLLQEEAMSGSMVIHGDVSRLDRRHEGVGPILRRPSYFGIVDARPISAQEVQRTLDPDTVLLCYSVRGEQVYMFLLSRSSNLAVHRLSLTEEEIWDQLDRFYLLLQSQPSRGVSESPSVSDEELDGDPYLLMGWWLYDRLVEPAEKILDKDKRILIMPDGPLHYLPFGALVRKTKNDLRGWQYLVEWLPLHTIQSATVYRNVLLLRGESRSLSEQDKATFVAFGDPYPPGDSAGANSPGAITPAARSGSHEEITGRATQARYRGLTGKVTMKSASGPARHSVFEPLPHTAREVTEIGRLFPAGYARLFLGANATEERAKRGLESIDYIHFALHGRADVEDPLESFLTFTAPGAYFLGRNDGFLHAKEIRDQLRLKADLVVLSACDTAFGPNRGGEGLMSLSRAFQMAGARTVAASLWPVADDSTAELMIRFYRHLLTSMPKDEALRAAQMELIAGPIEYVNAEGETVTGDFTAPYHWAAFQLIGDWQ